jgi:hypothetical protein
MSTTATLPLLHRFLGIGLIILAAVFAGVRFAGVELLPQGAVAQTIGQVMVGLAGVLMAVAWLVHAPRVPRRPPGVSVTDYWSTPEVAERVTPLWFLLEGAGILASVAYLMVGDVLSTVATVITIVVYWAAGPNRFTTGR